LVRAFVSLCVLVWLMAVSSAAMAHGLRSAFLEVEELEGGRATVHLKVTRPAPGLVLTSDCQVNAASEAAFALDRVFELACRDGTLVGHELTLRGLDSRVNDGVVWVRHLDGNQSSHVVSRASPSWTVPGAPSAWVVSRDYIRMGVVHILTGLDHLLFLVLLVLTLKSMGKIFFAETAFTLSHSISFAVTALGWIRVSQVAAEACIALSLLLLALDAVNPDAKPMSRLGGAAAAFVFGLVHGLGFAGGLREIGLPEHAVGTALVSFGGGVEIGQVLFLLFVLGVVRLGALTRFWKRIETGVVYAAGTLAAYWLIARVVQILAARA
jgi:hypothetical protein